MFGMSPGLNTSKGQYCIIIIAPPSWQQEMTCFNTNLNMQCPICTKLNIFGMSHGLKTSKGQYSVIIIAPPFGNRICHALYNSNLLCSICTKLHMFDKCAGLKTSTCQYPVIVIAPPAGSRKFGTYKWLWHIPSIFSSLNAYCSTFLSFWSHRWRWARVRGSRSSLLAALIRARAPMVWGPSWICSVIIIIIIIIIIILLRNESHFWGPKHARKVMKLCTRIRPGENLHLILVSEMGVAKWLDSATYALSTVCASSYVSRTCMKIGTLM